MIEKRKQNAKLGQRLSCVEDVLLFSQLIFYETMKVKMKLHRHTFFALQFMLASCDYKVVSVFVSASAAI